MPLPPRTIWDHLPHGPTLTVYPTDADTPRGAVLIFPGGGYSHLAAHEGESYAEALNAANFDAAVLQYRLAPDSRHPDMIHDAQRGMRLLRMHPSIRATAFAVIGSSAGGHLAASLAVHHQSFGNERDDLAATVSARPDAVVLCYPVIDLVGAGAHSGSRKNLFGETPVAGDLERMSLHRHVTSQTPPTFLWHTFEDQAVPVENSLLYAAACRAHGVPVELLCFERGRHGLGLALDIPDVRPWFASACMFLGRHLELASAATTQAAPASESLSSC